MATVEEYTEPYLGIYTPPPSHGEGVCDVCHGIPNPGYQRCWSCEQSIDSVSRPLTVIVPISWYGTSEQLWSALRGYKDSPDPLAREKYRLRVAATLHRFMRDHGDHVEAVAGGPWDVVTSVPSKGSREGAHPLERVIKLGRVLKRAYRPLLEINDASLVSRAHGDDRAFKLAERADVEGTRVLLLDDTFTSGATFQSAASALDLAGAAVVAGVVVGRVISTDDPRFPHRLEAWESRRAIPFTFETCCLE
jgi:adenine/guanine phosphoribosyltransferase-like PRPP-binding protein